MFQPLNSMYRPVGHRLFPPCPPPPNSMKFCFGEPGLTVITRTAITFLLGFKGMVCSDRSNIGRIMVAFLTRLVYSCSHSKWCDLKEFNLTNTLMWRKTDIAKKLRFLLLSYDLLSVIAQGPVWNLTDCLRC